VKTAQSIKGNAQHDRPATQLPPQQTHTVQTDRLCAPLQTSEHLGYDWQRTRQLYHTFQ